MNTTWNGCSFGEILIIGLILNLSPFAEAIPIVFKANCMTFKKWKKGTLNLLKSYY